MNTVTGDMTKMDITYTITDYAYDITEYLGRVKAFVAEQDLLLQQFEQRIWNVQCVKCGSVGRDSQKNLETVYGWVLNRRGEFCPLCTVRCVKCKTRRVEKDSTICDGCLKHVLTPMMDEECPF